jgi:hypothetical protein
MEVRRMKDALVFLLGVLVGLVVGMAVQWVADLPREYRR